MIKKSARRECLLTGRAKVLTRPDVDGATVTLVELGVETVVVQAPAAFVVADLIALDFALPDQATELHTIAKVIGLPDAEGHVLCELTFLPLLVRKRLQAWFDAGPPPRPAARLRVGRVG